jgi:hypothetical protein
MLELTKRVASLAVQAVFIGVVVGIFFGVAIAVAGLFI